MSVDPSINPVFFDWNIVYVWYCDGSGYTGDSTDAVEYDNETIYYRGAHIVPSVITTLNTYHNMSEV